jgi:four helix bundle protein
VSLVPVSPTPLAETDLPIAEVEVEVEVDDRFSTCGIGLVGSASTLEPGESGLGLGSSASISAAASTSVSSLWVIGRSRRLAFVSALSRTLRARAVARGADRISGRRSAPPVGHGSCALLGMTQRQDDKTSFLRFPHHGLDAYAVALDALEKADALAKKLPRGYGPLGDQLRRASQSAFLQLAEGAARSGADRAQRLRGARAEACEAAACVEALGRLGLATESEVAELLSLLGRLAAMLTKLAGR